MASGESKSALDGTVEAVLHLDGIFSDLTVGIDDETVVEDGQIVV